MNEHVINETPTEIAGAAGALAEVAALRDRLAVLEESLRASPPSARPGREAKPPVWKRTGVRLAAGALLTVLAGGTVALGAGALDALFIGPDGKVGIGTTAPAAKLHVAGSGWFGPDSGGLDATAGAGVRVYQEGGNGKVFSYNYTTGKPIDLILQSPGGNVGIGVTPKEKLEVAGSIKTDKLLIGTTDVMNAITTLQTLQTRVRNLEGEPIELINYKGEFFHRINENKLPRAVFYPNMRRVIFTRKICRGDGGNCRRWCELFKLPGQYLPDQTYYIPLQGMKDPKGKPYWWVIKTDGSMGIYINSDDYFVPDGALLDGVAYDVK